MTTTFAAALKRHSPSPRRRVALLSAGSLCVALPILLKMPDRTTAILDNSHWVALFVTIGFVISEPLVFDLEARNESISFSPTDIPLAVGLVALSPLTLVATRIVGSAILLIAWRRQPLFKFTLNLTAFTVECLLASIAFRVLVDSSNGASPAVWGWLIVSLMFGLLSAGVLIATAISFFEDDFFPRVRKEFSHSYLFYLPGAVLGASAAIPMFVEPWLVLIFMMPAPLVWIALRSHGLLMHRYTDLSNVFEFSSQVGRSTQLQEVAETAVREIAAQLRARSVALVVWDGGSGSVEASHGDDDLPGALPVHAADPDWQSVHGPKPVLIDARADSSALARRLASHGVSEAIVAPLHGEDRLIGFAVVADRQGAASHFTDDDESRMAKIQDQLGVALRKAQLHVQVQHEATHDRLTGLPNRPHFESWVDKSGAGVDEEAAIFLIDLDRFKEVNDTLGHHAGDDLLRFVTSRLRNVLADSDFAARFGGDEFAIYVPGAGEHEALLLAERVSQALERPFTLGDSTVAIAASIGVALAPDHGTDAATLLRRADLAMYDAKRRHHRSAVYRPNLDGNDSVRLAMLGDLRESLRDGSLSVVFQPKAELRTGAIIGVEALSRWTHNVHGSVSPDVFIPIAEQAGLMEQLTEFVLERSLEAAAHWSARGQNIGVAVNLSPVSLVNEELPRVVARCLEAAQVSPSALTLEITEQSAIIDTPRTVRILEQLAGLGVRISIDDFGTGHSSLTNLRKLPISELKIDRSFVGEMLVERNDDVIVKSTIDLGHNLGLSVVAEGVETAEARDRLRSLGCDLAQGYGICRPIPLDKLDRWLEATAVADDSSSFESHN